MSVCTTLAYSLSIYHIASEDHNLHGQASINNIYFVDFREEMLTRWRDIGLTYDVTWFFLLLNTEMIKAIDQAGLSSINWWVTQFTDEIQKKHKHFSEFPYKYTKLFVNKKSMW